uniref:RNA-directed RNA polymerase n=1 Tax=Chimba virus TaxID=2800910 RepID=A0A894KLA6_9VIRU|nr:MAG: RNA-dependent RNA polymerase [Chimba virus]
MKPKGSSRRRVNHTYAIKDNSTIAFDLATDIANALSVQAPCNSVGWINRDFPSTALEADVFRSEYLISEILSKYDAHNLGIDTQKAALEKFWEAEAMCKATNESFSKPNHGGSPLPGTTRGAVIHTARVKIDRLLGRFSWSEIALSARFSNGATTCTKRAKGNPSFKFGGSAECSCDVAPILESYLRNTVLEDKIPGYRVCNFNKATTVPKNSKTDRMIAMEPGWNMFFQLGAGAAIRKRLRRVSIDLNDQSINQRLARQGSIDNELSTIDLSMASDTVSSLVVFELLPPDWCDALDRLRSKRGYIDNVPHTYEKFSSMGNGFTFELETLIFWALCSSVCDLLAIPTPTISVYGDDIIMPSLATDLFMAVLSDFGFKPNVKKSFVDGPFRESCGKHYLNGVDVTPFYIRHQIDDVPSLILVLNNLYRWASIDGVMDPRLLPVYRKYAKLLPKFWQENQIPDGYGDGALVGSLVYNRHKKHVPHSGYCFKVKIIERGSKEVQRDEFGAYAASLHCTDQELGERSLQAATPWFIERFALFSSPVSAQFGYNNVTEIGTF